LIVALSTHRVIRSFSGHVSSHCSLSLRIYHYSLSCCLIPHTPTPTHTHIHTHSYTQSQMETRILWCAKDDKLSRGGIAAPTHTPSFIHQHSKPGTKCTSARPDLDRQHSPSLSISLSLSLSLS